MSPRVHSFFQEHPLFKQRWLVAGGRRSSRAWRWVRWIGIAIAGLFAVYLVGINILVQTRMLRSALSVDREEMLVDYTSAYSWIPGRVHVEGLSIRGSDWNIQWMLRIDKCDFHFSPLDFIHRRFHASHVRGDGLTFRVRLRVDSATPEHVAALPPIPGFGAFPHPKPGVRPPPPTDADYHLWSIQLDDVDARDVREIWTDTIRYSGSIRVRGRWIFRPMRWLDVGPAVVDAETLDISYGPHVLARGLQGSIGATVHPFDLRGHPGLQILEQVSTDLKLKGLFHAAETLETVAPVSGVTFARGDGPLDASIRVDHGVLVDRTRVSFETAESRTTSPNVVVEGPVKALFEVVAQPSSKPMGRLEVRGDATRLSGPKGATGTLRSAVASVASTELALDHAFGDATFVTDFDDAETPALGPWASSADVQSGPARASGHFEGDVPQKRAHGSLDFAVEDLALGGDDRVSATASGHIDVVDLSLSKQSLSLGRSRVQLKHVAARLGSAEIGAKTLDVSTELTASRQKQQISGGATLEGAGLNGHWKEVGIVGNLLAHLSGGVDLGDGSLDLAGSDVLIRDMQAHFGTTPLAGSLSINVVARRGPTTTDLSGTEVSFHAAPTSPSSKSPTEGWWARARLSKATLRRGPDSTFRATIHVTAKDASIAAAVIATQTAIPQWVLDAVPMTHLDATGDVLARPSSLRVHSLLARGDTDSVRLEYDSSSQSTEWALLVEEGALHVGFHQTPGGLDFAPFVGGPWFAARVAELNARESERP